MELLPKKEAKGLKREIQKLELLLGGVVNMKRTPQALYIVDTRKEHIAVHEARRLGIPIVAVVDTNSDPADADYVIPSNDDAIRAIKLFTSRISDACVEGRHAYEQKLQAGEVVREAAARPDRRRKKGIRIQGVRRGIRERGNYLRCGIRERSAGRCASASAC
jgi:small subunit ribosomal protein S2